MALAFRLSVLGLQPSAAALLRRQPACLSPLDLKHLYVTLLVDVADSTSTHH